MNFKIVNRFLVFALSLCTALFFFGNSSILNENTHLAKISEIIHGKIEHQSIQGAEAESLPFRIDARAEQPTEDDENVDTDIDFEDDEIPSNFNIDFTLCSAKSLIESKKLDDQSCPIYIRIHSLLI